MNPICHRSPFPGVLIFQHLNFQARFFLPVSREGTFDNLYGDTKPTKVVSQMLSGDCHSYFFWGVTFGPLACSLAAILRDAARNLQITVAFCSHWHHTTTHNWSITHGCMKTASC